MPDSAAVLVLEMQKTGSTATCVQEKSTRISTSHSQTPRRRCSCQKLTMRMKISKAATYAGLDGGAVFFVFSFPQRRD